MEAKDAAAIRDAVNKCKQFRLDRPVVASALELAGKLEREAKEKRLASERAAQRQQEKKNHKLAELKQQVRSIVSQWIQDVVATAKSQIKKARKPPSKDLVDTRAYLADVVEVRRRELATRKKTMAPSIRGPDEIPRLRAQIDPAVAALPHSVKKAKLEREIERLKKNNSRKRRQTQDAAMQTFVTDDVDGIHVDGMFYSREYIQTQIDELHRLEKHLARHLVKLKSETQVSAECKRTLRKELRQLRNASHLHSLKADTAKQKVAARILEAETEKERVRQLEPGSAEYEARQDEVMAQMTENEEDLWESRLTELSQSSQAKLEEVRLYSANEVKKALDDCLQQNAGQHRPKLQKLQKAIQSEKSKSDMSETKSKHLVQQKAELRGMIKQRLEEEKRLRTELAERSLKINDEIEQARERVVRRWDSLSVSSNRKRTFLNTTEDALVPNEEVLEVLEYRQSLVPALSSLWLPYEPNAYPGIPRQGRQAPGPSQSIAAGAWLWKAEGADCVGPRRITEPLGNAKAWFC